MDEYGIGGFFGQMGKAAERANAGSSSRYEHAAGQVGGVRANEPGTHSSASQQKPHPLDSGRSLPTGEASTSSRSGGRAATTQLGKSMMDSTASDVGDFFEQQGKAANEIRGGSTEQYHVAKPRANQELQRSGFSGTNRSGGRAAETATPPKASQPMAIPRSPTTARSKFFGG